MDRKFLVQIRLTEKELRMISSLSEEIFGGVSRSDVVRRCVQEKYSKAFPPYMIERRAISRSMKDEITPEQACEQSGGRVVMKDGTPMCVFQLSPNIARSVPLSKPELFKK